MTNIDIKRIFPTGSNELLIRLVKHAMIYAELARNYIARMFSILERVSRRRTWKSRYTPVKFLLKQEMTGVPITCARTIDWGHPRGNRWANTNKPQDTSERDACESFRQ